MGGILRFPRRPRFGARAAPAAATSVALRGINVVLVLRRVRRLGLHLDYGRGHVDLLDDIAVD